MGLSVCCVCATGLRDTDAGSPLCVTRSVKRGATSHWSSHWGRQTYYLAQGGFDERTGQCFYWKLPEHLPVVSILELCTPTAARHADSLQGRPFQRLTANDSSHYKLHRLGKTDQNEPLLVGVAVRVFINTVLHELDLHLWQCWVWGVT